MAQQVKWEPEPFDHGAVFQRWIESRNKCICKRPVEGATYSHVQHCAVCRMPLRTEKSR